MVNARCVALAELGKLCEQQRSSSISSIINGMDELRSSSLDFNLFTSRVLTFLSCVCMAPALFPNLFFSFFFGLSHLSAVISNGAMNHEDLQLKKKPGPAMAQKCGCWKNNE